MAANHQVRCSVDGCDHETWIRFDPYTEEHDDVIWATRELQDEHPDHSGATGWRFRKERGADR